MEDVTTRLGLDRLIRYRTELLDAQWDAAAGRWWLATSAGTLSAGVLVLAVGFLSEPALPQIDGLDRFRGVYFHSAQWDHGVDLTGKRVAVVGTGASAVQIVPEIAPRVRQLDVYQRTPAWVLPHPNRRVTDAERWLYRHFPASQTARRALAFASAEARHAVLTSTGPLNRTARGIGKLNIRRAVRDPVLADRLTPRYELGCKRVLLSNRYYPALARPNTEVISDSMTGTTGAGVLSGSGRERPADVIVFATGFRITRRAAFQRIRGDRGQVLADEFAEHGAYVGVAAAGFPNLFCVGGPTSGVGHTSFLFMLESQQRYIAEIVAAMHERELVAVEVQKEAWTGYFDQIQADTADKVWLSGCTSWFLDERKRNVAVWPGYSWTFRRRTRRFDEAAYRLVPSAPAAEQKKATHV